MEDQANLDDGGAWSKVFFLNRIFRKISWRTRLRHWIYNQRNSRVLKSMVVLSRRGQCCRGRRTARCLTSWSPPSRTCPGTRTACSCSSAGPRPCCGACSAPCVTSSATLLSPRPGPPSRRCAGCTTTSPPAPSSWRRPPPAHVDYPPAANCSPDSTNNHQRSWSVS